MTRVVNPETRDRIKALEEVCANLRSIAETVCYKGLYAESEQINICADVVYSSIEEILNDAAFGETEETPQAA